jgi:hypothetical protein
MLHTNPAQIIDLSSSFKGDKIAIANYADDGFVEMCDFDAECGTVTNSIKLPQSTTQIPWDYPLGVEFSPNGQYLYVCYSNGLSQLVQYEVSNTNNKVVIHSTSDDANQFDDISMAPDGKAYLNRHNFGSPSRQIDVIESPNLGGLNCGFKPNAYELLLGTNGGFQLPPFINSYLPSYCGRSVREFQDGYNGSPCVGQKLEFYSIYPDNTYDSVNWKIEYNTNLSYSRGKNAVIELVSEGFLKVMKVKYFCNLKDTIYYSFEVKQKPKYQITVDTTVCFGDSVFLEVETSAEKILWNTGETNNRINVREGFYKVKLSNGECMVEDSVNVSSFPPLSILLGDHFYICERENELVKLDAGKGFANYLWHPTQDTTQWIVVNKIGNYFVIVEDFRGCRGDKGTEVDQRCDLVYFVPNAVGPGQGLQENFRVIGDGIVQAEMKVYNRWGEKIFEGDGLTGWNPNNFPVGVYLYTIKITGYKSKTKRLEYKSGNVTIFR